MYNKSKTLTKYVKMSLIIFKQNRNPKLKNAKK